jgi:lipopolysaccharide heptosyltransferase II
MTSRWNRALSVLCVRLDALGDLVMTTPAIRALKESVPGRRISLLTSPAGAAAAPFIPEIDEHIVCEAPWVKACPPRASSAPELAAVERLRLPAALLCYLADIPLRLAFCRENPYQLLTDWLPDPEPAACVRHEARRQLDLVAAVGAEPASLRYSFRVPATARDSVTRRLDEAGLDRGAPWVMIHPGATAASRRYAPESFATVATTLAEWHGWSIVWTGDPGEIELVEGIRTRMPRARGVSLAGELSLAELAAVIEQAPVLISNNTGPVHLAGAVGTPVVDLYALTNPQHTPWQVPHRVLSHDVPCRYCYKSVCPEGHHDCLRLIAPQAVVEAALALVREAPKEPFPRRSDSREHVPPLLGEAACTLLASTPLSTTLRQR